ncbi:MAG TPA: ABC transporter ATP-binding protein [Mycobacteriales bacterium]|nr:ABC transporter ATP-binding protein [Mycobacteriales bacterium]
MSGLAAGYGTGRVLHGVDLEVPDRQVLTILGRNGVGKTTLMHSIMGLVRPTAGSVTLDGVELVGRPTHRIARVGVALVPQGRRVFAPLSVEENLRIAARHGQGDWTTARIFDMFPRLAQRRRLAAGLLSGGEQQMLAIARALVMSPRILLLDEPSEGLAPVVVEQVGEVIAGLRTSGLSVLLVEQNIGLALPLADTVLIMVKGQIAYRGSQQDFRGDRDTARELLGIT